MSSESGSSQKQPQSTVDLTSMTPMEFTVISEPWVKYKLEDQTKLFVKLVVIKVVRGLNEQGQPAYNMNAQNIIATHGAPNQRGQPRSEEHTSELQSRLHLVCRLLLEKKKKQTTLPLLHDPSRAVV